MLASSTCGSPQRARQFLFDSDAGLILKAFARKTAVISGSTAALFQIAVWSPRW